VLSCCNSKSEIPQSATDVSEIASLRGAQRLSVRGGTDSRFRSVRRQGTRHREPTSRKAQEGSQLEVVQAKVQRTEIELALRQRNSLRRGLARNFRRDRGKFGDDLGDLCRGRIPIGSGVGLGRAWRRTNESRRARVPVRRARVSQSQGDPLCRQEKSSRFPNIEVELASGFDNATDSE